MISVLKINCGPVPCFILLQCWCGQDGYIHCAGQYDATNQQQRQTHSERVRLPQPHTTAAQLPGAN